jgi:hypothetical protein
VPGGLFEEKAGYSRAPRLLIQTRLTAKGSVVEQRQGGAENYRKKQGVFFALSKLI